MESSPPLKFPTNLWIRLGLVAVAVLTVLLAVHRLDFVSANTVNILYWDQWDIYDPLFRGDGWWGLFSHQHGPHRQGVGFLATAGLARLTQWDSRGDALLTVAATIAAALGAFPLARRCGARSGIALVTVPLIFLTMRQFEAWIGPANPSHGAFPILLTLLYGLTWFLRSLVWRLVLQVVLTLGLVFTGFGLFAGALSPVLLGIEAWRHRRKQALRPAVFAAVACLLTIGVWVLFFTGYKNQPAVAGFHFPHERPIEYGYFSALMLASYLGWHGHLMLDLAGGFVFLGLLLIVAVVHGIRILRTSPTEEPASAVLLILSAGTLLYCINTAVGRVVLGWQEAPYAPRYVTLIAPGILALYLQAERLTSHHIRNACWAALLALVAWSGLVLSPGDREAAAWYRRGREKWKDVYLTTGSQHEANVATSPDQGFTIHPGDLTAKLRYLREHRLNLFAPGQP